jgi:hypothetical protein
MTKTILIILVLTINLNSFGQKQYDNLANDVCNCVEKNSSIKDSKQLFTSCMEEELFNHVNELKEIEGVESVRDLDFKKIGRGMVPYLFKECDWFIRYIQDEMDSDEKREQNVDKGYQDYFKRE